MLYKEQIDKNRIPAHVAIIMDGNGRWAKQKNQPRSFGHQAGAETVHVIAEEAARLGVKYLTLYTFSTENWNRPVDEVNALMTLLMESIEEEIFMKNNISFRIIGDVEKLPENVLNRLNGKIYLIVGNHDMKNLRQSYYDRFEEIVMQKHIEIGKQKIYLNHCPFLCYGGAYKDTWQLFGHVHTSKNNTGKDASRLNMLFPTQYDVGVDNNNFTPVSFDQVKAIIQKQVEQFSKNNR